MLFCVQYQAADDEVIYKEGLLYRKLVENTGGKKGEYLQKLNFVACLHEPGTRSQIAVLPIIF